MDVNEYVESDRCKDTVVNDIEHFRAIHLERRVAFPYDPVSIEREVNSKTFSARM